MKVQLYCFVVILTVLALALMGCGSTSLQGDEPEHELGSLDEMPVLSAVSLGEGERLQVVATTSIVADVVQNVGGERIELTVLMPPGSDPHSFEPTPRDVAAVVDAHAVLINGAGLEIFIEPLLESAGGATVVVPVSAGLSLLHAGGEHEVEGDEEPTHEHGDFDPHVWFNVDNVIQWTHNVEQALATLDPANAAAYEANAAAYRDVLRELDAWIVQQVAQVPESNRVLVTDHTVLTYFAERYGFEQVGAVFPGYSTLAEPSARELAELQDTIRAQQVPAVFVSITVNASLAQQVADDTGIDIIYLYTGSLSEAGGPADTYVELMRYDVSAIVEALR